MKSYRVRERAHPELLEDLLLARGITKEDRENFLTPEFGRDSHDPMLLPDMERAVDRILHAFKYSEHVAVWSDYDADGIPGGVLLTEFLRAIGLTVTHYIPHRHKEGYGLNNEGLEELANSGVKVVITVDLGTTDIEPIAFAGEKGMDVIVTDHHLVLAGGSSEKFLGSASPQPDHFLQNLPPALALINPKRPDSTYPFDGLCGAGVAWKLVQGILSKYRPQHFGEGQEKWLLDLVALGTLSDMVPLVGENRMLGHFGLKVMRRARRPGLAALLSVLRIKPETLTEDDVGFMISPRINAASRMDSPEVAANLLRAGDRAEAQILARALNAINDERKGLVAATVKEVNKRMSLIDDAPVIVMGNPNWRPGILGLVANTLAEAHHKPVFLWGREGGELLRGSCRSDGPTNMVALMERARDVFEDFGGHAASGGFSLKEERVHELAARLGAAQKILQEQTQEESEVVVDRDLEIAELSHAIRDLSRLAPFGVGNQKPLFMFSNVSIAKARMFGKQQNHLEMSLEQADARADSIAFFSTPASFTKKFEVGSRADIVGHVERDWRGGPRIRIVDVI